MNSSIGTNSPGSLCLSWLPPESRISCHGIHKPTCVKLNHVQITWHRTHYIPQRAAVSNTSEATVQLAVPPSICICAYLRYVAKETLHEPFARFAASHVMDGRTDGWTDVRSRGLAFEFCRRDGRWASTPMAS